MIRKGQVLLITFLWMIFACNAEKQTIPSVHHPQWSLNKTIYELNVRQFSNSGTFKAVERRLPALQDLGVGIIWLMPIQPIGEKNRKGTLGSPYAVKDYFKVNPDYGSMADLKSLVNKAHRLGMYVILDWVANHTAWDNPLLKAHSEWYTHDSRGKISSPVADWTDVADLDYTHKDLWLYMIKAMKYWVQEADVDGFRCDVAERVPLAFWNQVRDSLEMIKPVFMLAEGDAPELHDHAFDATYSWNLYYLMNDIAGGEKKASDITGLLNKEKKMYPPGAMRMRFTTNHDENAWNGTALDRLDGGFKAFTVLTVTIPGKPMIYNGQEAGLNKSLAFFEKDPIEWRINNYRRFYRRILNLYQANPALYEGEMKEIDTSDKAHIFAFVREKDDHRIVVILNLSPQRRSITVSSSLINGTFLEYFSGMKVHYGSGHMFDLEPWAYRLFIKE